MSRPTVGAQASSRHDPGAGYIVGAGFRLHTDAVGSGAPILLIHGASSDKAVFRPTVIPALRGLGRLISYDRPGMGASDPAQADGRLGVQAAAAALVVEALASGPALIVAHSYGGAVALRLALDRPDLVNGLVLVAPVAYPWPGGVAWHNHVSAAPVVGAVFNRLVVPIVARSASEAGLAEAFAPQQIPPEYSRAIGVERAFQPKSLAANGRALTALKSEVSSQAPRYREIKHPVGLLAGDADAVVSTQIHTSRLDETLPLTRLDIVQDGGHLPHEIEPHRLVSLVEWAMSIAAPQVGLR
ncbi:alpha/beta fold hydrolase [bacterium]|nr:alpha/beta fold hydrolase [bacterium]